MDDYVEKIISTAHQLNGIGFPIEDEWLGTFLLAGLSDEWRPMIMGLESSGQKITGDLVKSKILQEAKTGKTDAALGVFKKKNKKPQKNESLTPYCFKCESSRHWTRECPSKQNRDNGKGGKKALSAVLSTGVADPGCWYFDSGATNHLSKHQSWIKNFQEKQGEIIAADVNIMQMTGFGTAEVEPAGSTEPLEIQDVQVVPDLFTHLLSIGKIVKKGNRVIFDQEGCCVMSEADEVIATGTIDRDLFKLDVNKKQTFTC